MATQNKITKATFKKFIKENEANLFIWAKSSFNGQTDCVEDLDTTFKPAEKTTEHLDYTLGYRGLWLVGQSRDYFRAYENETYKGIEVFDSCGTSYVAIKK